MDEVSCQSQTQGTLNLSFLHPASSQHPQVIGRTEIQHENVAELRLQQDRTLHLAPPLHSRSKIYILVRLEERDDREILHIVQSHQRSLQWA